MIIFIVLPLPLGYGENTGYSCASGCPMAPRLANIIAVCILAVAAAAAFGFRPTVRQQRAVPDPTQTRPVPRILSDGRIPDIPLAVPDGFRIRVFADGLGHPRTLVFSPGGTLLVSDPDADTVTALPDADGNGVADRHVPVVASGNRVHGLAFSGGRLYVAEVDRVVSYAWNESDLTARSETVLFPLPANRDHNNRSILFGPTGRMFVSVGSTCNVCLETDAFSGSVVAADAPYTTPRVYSSGLRDAAFMTADRSGRVWVTEMGRDYLGDDLPPDEIDVLTDGGNFGWPFCYGVKIRDTSFRPTDEFSCAETVPPVYGISAHSAPLGIAFIPAGNFPVSWTGDLIVAYHGSWNRSVPTGYKVVRLNRSGDSVTGSTDFVTGFFENGVVSGRPAGIAFDSSGRLYISDDKTGMIYIVQTSP